MTGTVLPPWQPTTARRIKPTIEAIETRREWQRRAESRHGQFAPVDEPDYRPFQVSPGKAWKAIWPGLLSVGTFFYVALLVWAYVSG